MNFNHAGRERSPSKALEIATVFIVDSDAAVRETLERLLRSAGWQTRSASSAEEFLALPRATAPGCLLAELSLPGVSGLELQRLVLDRTELPIVFLTDHADVLATVRAMKAGAFEFMTKPFVGDVLLRAITQAIETSRAALRHLAQSRALQERYASLSRREREVMSLVVSGRLNKQAGAELGISEITVKAHRGSIMRKMQAGSFAELVNMAARLPREVVADRTAMDAPFEFAYIRRATERIGLDDSTREALALSSAFMPLRNTHVSTETFA